MADLTYDNRTGRPAGRAVRGLGLVIPGVARVRGDVAPFARYWHAHNQAALQQPGRRWVVFGDSMAQGVGASSPTAGWVGQLADRLQETGHDLPLVNLSASGARVLDVIDQQVPAWQSLPPTGQPDLVTVLIGSNDLFVGRRIREALPDSMARLLALMPTGTVIAALPQPRRAAHEANRHLDAAAAAGQVHVVDMRTQGPQSWRGLIAADFFHPNDRGYAALADAFEPVVRAALD